MKSFFSKILGLKEKKNYNTGWVSLIDGYNTKYKETFSSYVYACIACRAENIAKAGINFYRNNYTSGRVELTRHPFLDMIRRPNKFNQSFENLLYLISVSLDLYGNAYLLIERTGGTPTALYYLPFGNTRVILDKDNRKIISYEYREGSKTFNIPSSDVIHFLIPSPLSNITGKSLVSAFNFTLDIDYYQNLFQKMFYMNNASIGLILECPENLNDEQFERLETKINQKYTGVDNSGKPLILEGGLKASSYKPSVKDVEMLPARKMIRDEILAIMRVPKIILGILEDVNYAGSREAIRIFNDYTIKPFAKLCIESKFNIFLKENYSGDLKLTLEYDFENDRELQLKAYEIYRKYDIVSKEEIRELEGFSKSIKN
ncbi:MAG TPA: phage portal protein [Ignavibacteria bacterium]